MPAYPEEMVAPMRAEVVAAGAKELRSRGDVEEAFAHREGTSLFFINSVCGCAAGSARPGLSLSLERASVRPDRIYTVFAGMEPDAVEALRERLIGYPPSSPGLSLWKDGDLVAVVERHHIQHLSGEQLAESLGALYAEHCAAATA